MALGGNSRTLAIADAGFATQRHQPEREFGYARYLPIGKRGFDVAFTLLILPLILPVIAVLWLLVRCDGGPAFYGHRRVGEDGRSFYCWKLRTMVVDSEARLQAHLAENPSAAAEWARDFKLENDPRITWLGKFLRRSSLDELPQFFNVLRGDMSVVGPRPVTTPELARYGQHAWAYLGTRPGITGLWQVSGRNDIAYDERVKMDVDYFHRHNLALDILLVVKTAMAMVIATGR